MVYPMLQLSRAAILLEVKGQSHGRLRGARREAGGHTDHDGEEGQHLQLRLGVQPSASQVMGHQEQPDPERRQRLEARRHLDVHGG